MRTVITVVVLMILLTSCALPLAIAGVEIDRAIEACEKQGGLSSLEVRTRMEAKCAKHLYNQESRMKTYTYRVTKGTGAYDLTVDGPTEPDALEQAEKIAKAGTSLELVDSREGTLEDYLGPEAVARIAHNSRRLQKTGKRSYTPKDDVVEGATRAHKRT